MKLECSSSRGKIDIQPLDVGMLTLGRHARIRTQRRIIGQRNITPRNQTRRGHTIAIPHCPPQELYPDSFQFSRGSGSVVSLIMWFDRGAGVILFYFAYSLICIDGEQRARGAGWYRTKTIHPSDHAAEFTYRASALAKKKRTVHIPPATASRNTRSDSSFPGLSRSCSVYPT